jgi:hypothetical protein
MQDNFDYVQRGFRILVSAMSGFIGQTLNRTYGKSWWEQVRQTLYDQCSDLPQFGSYSELVDSLDVANCIRLLDRRWRDDFRTVLPRSCRAWANELMGVRNEVAHLGQKDLEQPQAERALDTMARLCAEIDSESAKDIRELYREVRSRAEDATPSVVYTGLQQPASASRRGTLEEGSLLKLVGTKVVQKTDLTRKVVFGGKTAVYPVYRVQLDHLFYNDQNDRIATWISHYETEHGKNALSSLNTETYNKIIEEFIFDSNPDAIQKTQKNIQLIGQREPGVTLAGGRIVDGNRRFTCLRRIAQETGEQGYFETVLIDVDIHADKKQIKLLELSIQHGEEKKVDYDLIDYAIGTYRDIIQTRLLTVEEYAASTNESPADVKKRIEIAGVICEFLEYIRLPEQYYAAREYQVYSIFQEMLPIRPATETDRKLLKTIVFQNAMMHAIADQRKFIRDIKTLVKKDLYQEYFEDQRQIGQRIRELFSAFPVSEKADVDAFASSHAEIGQALNESLERALLLSRSKALKAKPMENAEKGYSLLLDIDPRQFGKMNTEEKENLKSKLKDLIALAVRFSSQL